MKRSPALTQLSREHHLALVLARRAQGMGLTDGERASSFMTQAVETFRHGLEPHFQTEEGALLPALNSVGEHRLVRRALAEHEELRRAENGDRRHDRRPARDGVAHEQKAD